MRIWLIYLYIGCLAGSIGIGLVLDGHNFGSCLVVASVFIALAAICSVLDEIRDAIKERNQ